MKTLALSTLSLTLLISSGCVASQLKDLQPSLPRDAALAQQYLAQTGRIPVEYRVNWAKLLLSLALAGSGVAIAIFVVLSSQSANVKMQNTASPQTQSRRYTSGFEPETISYGLTYRSPTLETMMQTNQSSVASMPDLIPADVARRPRQFASAAQQVDDVVEVTAEAEIIEPQFKWAHNLINYPVVLLYGPQGGGKTSKLAWITAEHARRGDEVSMIDQFAPAESWKGLEVIGRGENVAEINQQLEWFSEEASRRLALRGTDSSYDPLRNESFCFMGIDEVTNMEDLVDSDIGRRFISTCTQKLRQAGMGVVISSHGETLSCLFGMAAGRGKKDVLDRQILKIEVIPTEDLSVPGGFRCSGQARLTYNGKTRTVVVPQYMRKPENWDYRPIIPQDDSRVVFAS